ncbi:MAG: outer membrane beta-barrel protein [Bacteroidia bacterium]
MRKLLTFILFCILLLPVHLAAQQELKLFRFFSIDLEWQTWQQKPGDVELEDALGRGVSIHVIQPLVRGQKRFWVVTGLGISSTNIFNNVIMNYRLDLDGQLPVLPDDVYRKNKLSLNYLEVPLHTTYRFRKDSARSLSVTLGVKGGFLIDSHTKMKGNNGMIYKTKKLEAPNDYRYGVFARIGNSRVHLYGYYALSTVFKEDYPDVNLFSVGLSYSGF